MIKYLNLSSINPTVDLRIILSFLVYTVEDHLTSGGIECRTTNGVGLPLAAGNVPPEFVVEHFHGSKFWLVDVR